MTEMNNIVPEDIFITDSCVECTLIYKYIYNM